MHELSLATEIVDTALQAAFGRGGEIEVVHVAMNAGSHLDGDILSEAFTMAATGTPAEGAVLNLEVGEGDTGELAVTAIDVRNVRN